MSTLLLTFLADFWPIVAAVAAFLGWGRWQRTQGAKEERARHAAERLAARDLADEIEDAVAGRSPDENRAELKRWSPWGKS